MKQHLRVLVVSLDYPPPALGGYEVMCANVCQWLAHQGHDMQVLTVLPQQDGISPENARGADEISVRRVLGSYWDGTECLYPPLREALRIEQDNQAQFQAAVRDHRPDVVSFWHMGAMSLSLITTTARLGLPMVFVIGDDWLCYGWWADAWIRRFRQHPRHAEAVERQTGIPTRLPDLGSMGSFCFVSHLTKQRAEQLGRWQFPRSDIIPPGVAPAEFPPITQAPARDWNWRLLWVGRVIEEKGVETAIRALAFLPVEATLDIVGPVEPHYRQHLEELAGALGLAGRLIFSQAGRAAIRFHYQHADVTLFTSQIDSEAFGLVPLEAMTSGCPVLSTGVGGSAEYCVDQVNCLRIPPGDADRLAQAVQELASSPDLRSQLIAGGLQTARNLTSDRQARRIEEWLLRARAIRP